MECHDWLSLLELSLQIWKKSVWKRNYLSIPGSRDVMDGEEFDETLEDNGNDQGRRQRQRKHKSKKPPRYCTCINKSPGPTTTSMLVQRLDRIVYLLCTGSDPHILNQLLWHCFHCYIFKLRIVPQTKPEFKLGNQVYTFSNIEI